MSFTKHCVNLLLRIWIHEKEILKDELITQNVVLKHVGIEPQHLGVNFQNQKLKRPFITPKNISYNSL